MEHAPRIFSEIVQRLERLYMMLSEAEPTDLPLRKIAALAHRGRELEAISAGRVRHAAGY